MLEINSSFPVPWNVGVPPVDQRTQESQPAVSHSPLPTDSGFQARRWTNVYQPALQQAVSRCIPEQVAALPELAMVGLDAMGCGTTHAAASELLALGVLWFCQCCWFIMVQNGQWYIIADVDHEYHINVYGIIFGTINQKYSYIYCNCSC